uniref:Uncharacterized protein n=1 Tax=Chenopodium quinoa TaxID=63459 RepID=A0A803MUU4_CHEQI
MGYVLRVRLASFFAGAAVASSAGLYILYKDYKLAHHSISDQSNSSEEGRYGHSLLAKAFDYFAAMKRLHDSLDTRVSALEKLKQPETPRQEVEATEELS